MSVRKKKEKGKVCRTCWIPFSVNEMLVKDMKERSFPPHWLSKWMTEAVLGECAKNNNLEALKLKEDFRAKHAFEIKMRHER